MMVFVTGIRWIPSHHGSRHERLNDYDLVFARDRTIAGLKSSQFIPAIAIDRSPCGYVVLSIVELDRTKSDERTVFELNFSRCRISG